MVSPVIALFILSLLWVTNGATAGDFTLPKDALKRFFGEVRASYFWPATLPWQFENGLGVPDLNVQLDDGNYLVSGCVPHFCDDKSAVIAAGDGRIRAGAMLYFLADRPDRICTFRDPMLVIFVRPKDGDQTDAVEKLKEWAPDVLHREWVYLTNSIPETGGDACNHAEPRILATNVIELPANKRGTLPPTPRLRPPHGA
jgi:hypothetical protein